MAVKTIDEYRKMAEGYLNPLYQGKQTTLQSGADSQINGITSDYGRTLKDAETTNAMDMNNFNKSLLSRNMARGSIATTGMAEQNELGKKRLDDISYQRDNQISNVRSNLAAQLSALDNEKLSQILSQAQDMYNTDYNRDFQERQFAADQAYKQQQLAKAAEEAKPKVNPNLSYNSSNADNTPNTVMQSAISSLSKAMQNGQGNAWIQANREAMQQMLTPEEQQALSPGGYIYHQLLKGD